MDRPDDTSGSQVQVVYMLPADGVDQSLDTNGTVAGAVEWARSWFSGQTGGRRVRFDTVQGALNVTFLRTTRSDAEYVSMGNRIRDGVAADLAAAGFANPTKISPSVDPRSHFSSVRSAGVVPFGASGPSPFAAAP